MKKLVSILTGIVATLGISVTSSQASIIPSNFCPNKNIVNVTSSDPVFLERVLISNSDTDNMMLAWHYSHSSHSSHYSHSSHHSHYSGRY